MPAGGLRGMAGILVNIVHITDEMLCHKNIRKISFKKTYFYVVKSPVIRMH